MKKGIVLLADGFEEIEALTVVDLLRRAGIDTVMTGVTGNIVTGSHGIKVVTDIHITDLKSSPLPDVVVIPGGMPGARNIAESSDAAAIINKAAKAGVLIAAICAAPSVVLYPMGLLKGKRAVCYPGMESDWKGVLFTDEPLVQDANILTSKGVGTAAEFALAIISNIGGDAAAQSVRKKTLL
ncbi:MAG: DJ-1/PfpI family protein [Spirochaetales bacterium]|nr:DJ-1/PfpI family protein [Spirochaetales bacterium]